MREKSIHFLLIVGAFVVGGFFNYYVVNQEQNKTITVGNQMTETTGVVKCNNDIHIDETGISLAVGKIYDAAVTIQNYQGTKIASSGSGFIYKKDDQYGYIMTNHHVVNKSTKLVITLSNDEQIEGTVLGSDQYLDLAVVRIDAKYVKQVATIGNSENTNVGDTIFTVGTPVGYEYRGTVTRGTLSGKNRMVSVSVTSTEDWMMKVLQIDAAINPGNSGGPLLNINGEVIGINSLKLVENTIEGMGFAIPIEYAMNYVEILEQGKVIERPLIGINMLNVTDTYKLFQQGIMLDSSIESGVVVISTVEGSGADKAGLKKGDVILKVGNKTITNAAYLKYELYQYSAGDTVEITYMRENKTHTVKVILGTTE